jgi:asparagine synthase (glutamine-hydrolysing)
VSAIAGVSGAHPTALAEHQVRQMLAEQRVYGSDRTQLAALGGAAFGICPWREFGDAPTVSRRLLLAADIRLDNREDLFSRIGPAPHPRNDNALLLAAWEKFGEDCLQWVCGDFAIAIYDAEARTITLARDPTGQMPLHYAQRDERTAFASMPSGLRPFVSRLTIDRISLAAAACGIRDDDPRSNFEEVARVLPGEVVRLRAGGQHRRIYWAPATIYDGSNRQADLVQQYRQALDVAVADCLGSVREPVATHLSSGYDSSAVTATAARLREPQDIIAFTSAPAMPAAVPASHWRIGDESEIAAATASHLGVRHAIVRDVPRMRDVMERQFGLSQELNINVPNLAWLQQIRSEAANARVTRLLSGECGNASLNAGGLYVLSEWIRQQKWLTWTRQAWHAAARPDTHWRGVLFTSFNPWLPTRVSDGLRRLRFGAAPTDQDSFMRPEWRAKALSSLVPTPHFADGYQARIHLIRNGNPAMLRKSGLGGEAIDERDPLADRRLVEFSLKIPPEQLYWNGVSRPLARAALADRVPRSVIDLRVRGLQAADWAARFTKNEAFEILEEISTCGTAQELFDLDRMRDAIGNWPTENWNRRRVHGVFRRCLIAALAGGMFALVHEKTH